jgi:hypothetical protein
MSSILLSPKVLSLLIAETGSMILLFFTIINAFRIYHQWNYESSTPQQYTLEKKSYFVSTAVLFIIIVKLILFPFFAHTVDALSVIVPGAMCGAGVINANDYGMAVFVLKLTFLFLGIVWIAINRFDILSQGYPLTRLKYRLFFPLALLAITDFIVQLLYFTHISTDSPVMCCSVIYGISDGGSSLPLGLSLVTLTILFGVVFALFIASTYLALGLYSFVSGILFLYFGYYVLLHLFGIYIYELPTHICPFCMLQKEYNYIGYVMWGILFMGSFLAMFPFVLSRLSGYEYPVLYRYALFFGIAFVVIGSGYILRYYLLNGVFL